MMDRGCHRRPIDYITKPGGDQAAIENSTSG